MVGHRYNALRLNFSDQVFNFSNRQPDDGMHCTLVSGGFAVHEIASFMHQPDSVLTGNNPGGIQGDAIPLRCDYRRLQALHTGVMNTAMADGSVRGISANISALTFERICTKDLGEVLGGDWQ